MADEPIDQRPRRRLFGRRRVESVQENPRVGHVTVTESSFSRVEAPPAETPLEPTDEVESAESPRSEAAEPEAVDAEESAAESQHVAEVHQPEERREPDPTPEAPAPEAPQAEAPEPEAPEATEAEAPETVQATSPEEPPLGVEDEEAMVTANPAVPEVPAPAVAEIATEPDLELAGQDGAGGDAGTEVEQSTAPAEPVIPPLDAPAISSNEAAGELPLPRVIAIANQKGGVGKTTTAVNLGAALAEAGFRVLVVDLDPQGNASTGLGINPRDVETSVYDVIMTDAPALDCVEPTSLKNLFVLPATIDLAGAEIELVSAFSRELKLRRALDAVRPEYDIILIDCPPSLGLLTVNGLAAADDVIVPVQSEYYALEGLGQLLKNVAMVRSLNPTLDVRGIVLTMHDSRTKLAEQVESEVRQHFGARVYKTVVPRTVRLSEAPSFGQPIIVFDPTSRGATAYRELAKEVSGGATRRSR
jgi:chromosome partitioning protein